MQLGDKLGFFQGSGKDADTEGLRQRLATQLGRPLALVLTQNRRIFISFRQGEQGAITLRLHRVFLEADPETLGAIRKFLQREDIPRAREQLRRFFLEHRQPAAPPPPSVRRLTPRGHFYDLEQTLASLNARYFEGRVLARITWGRQVPSRSRRRIRLGSYNFNSRIITIHPLLDRPEIPDFVLEQTIHHEMLHALLGVTRSGRRRILHSRQFRELERSYERFQEAHGWLDRNLESLLKAGTRERVPKGGV